MALFTKKNHPGGNAEEKGEPKLSGKALAAEEMGKGEMTMPMAKKGGGQFNLPRTGKKPKK